MLYTLRFFSSKCSLFHNANLFSSCIIHILYTGCAKIKKYNSCAKGLMINPMTVTGEVLRLSLTEENLNSINCRI